MHMSCADAGGRCDLSCGVCAVREAWMDAIQTETTTSTRRRLADSCRYANDGECDEPRWCRAGTDDTDCGRDTSWMEYLALVTKGANACTSARPCARCHGDCDTDRDCAGNLICFQRGSFEHVPGCKGGYGTDGWDYCYDPNIQRGQGCDLFWNQYKDVYKITKNRKEGAVCGHEFRETKCLTGMEKYFALKIKRGLKLPSFIRKTALKKYFSYHLHTTVAWPCHDTACSEF
jgi:hypothetical protein